MDIRHSSFRQVSAQRLADRSSCQCVGWSSLYGLPCENRVQVRYGPNRGTWDIRVHKGVFDLYQLTLALSSLLFQRHW